VAHTTPYFRVLRAEVERPDGTRVEYHTIDFPRPAVAIVLRNPAGEVLLIRQQRFIVGREVWALPSGGVEVGEAPAVAAARELLEETGHEAERLGHLLTYYPSYGVANQVFHCYLADGPIRRRRPDPNEVERIAWFGSAELRALLRSGDVPDGFSLTPILWLMSGLEPQPDTEARRCPRVVLGDV
jgi:8-oxo-dGTP pyrophosphatase MutT (NUDIX family)